MWFFLLLPLLAFSQTDIDISAIQDLESILPDQDIKKDAYKNIEFERRNRDFRPPVRKVELEEIKNSNLTYAFVKAGTPVYRISDNKVFLMSKDIYLKVYELIDEQGFQYLRNKDQTTTYKISEMYVTKIADTMMLYEPPTRFTPKSKTLIKTEYDKKLKLVPEVAFYLGIVQAQYLRDLFNDPKAASGKMNQYGLHYFTQWKLPFKVGAALHYERTTYNLTGGGLAYYDAISIGPQFRTKDFDLFETNWRITTQIRVSPFARVRGQTANGDVNFKFNSTDLMTTAEHPWENRFGQFVVGGFHQIQWLSMKDQPEAVSIRASNQTNQSFGLFVAQVFQ
jgi:hypothetical protein